MRTRILLLSKLENLGEPGDIVQVNGGYARNYLLPYGKAKPATPENIEEFRLRRKEWEEIESGKLSEARQRKEKIDALELGRRSEAQRQGNLGSAPSARLKSSPPSRTTAVKRLKRAKCICPTEHCVNWANMRFPSDSIPTSMPASNSSSLPRRVKTE